MIKLPETTEYIIEKIEKNGFEAFAVGGCIRDSLLGRVPNDWDIATSAKPEDIMNIFENTVETGIEHGTVTVVINKEPYEVLGRVPNDWDIATSAKPEDIMNIFENTVETGIEHGTVTVVINKEPYEVTTYRIDGDYTDGRHPDSVEFTFTENIEEDLSRRDFTINAMAYNNSTGLVDVFGGRDDLENKVIRCVGDPRKRFEEDALRMMRGIRFSAQLGFSIESDTFKAIEEMSDLISAVSIERINVEFTKTLMSDAKKIMIYHERGILKNILPELYKIDSGDYNREFSAVEMIKMGVNCADLCKKDLACRLAGFFIYINEAIGLENTRKILKKMRYDNKTISKACELLKYGMRNISNNKEDLKYLLMKLDSVEMLEDLIDLKAAEVDISKACELLKYGMRNISNNKEDLKYLLMKLDSVEMLEDLIDLKAAEVDTYLEERKSKFEEKSEEEKKIESVGIEVLEAFTVEALIVLNNVENTLKEIVDNGECFRVKDLDINGKDLIAAGIKPGKEIGEMLNKILKEVIKNPDINKKEKLLEMIK